MSSHLRQADAAEPLPTSSLGTEMRQRVIPPELIHSSSSGSKYKPDAAENKDLSLPTLPHFDRGQRKENGGDTAGTGGSGYYHEYFAKGAHRKTLRQGPFFSRPVKGTEEIWLEKDQEAAEWLSLFYDLVVVAVLTIFSTQHELATPSAIPVFLSFFVIIFWVWVSQTAYDMRYQGNDTLNRLFKFIQIGLFIYQGAAGGNWNPGKIEVFGDSADPYGARASQHEDALQSFITVVFAFAVSRAILALQYGIWRRAGRKIKHIGITIVSLLVSMMLAILAVTLPSTTQNWKVVKIVLFYSGIGVEVTNVFVAVLLRVQPPLETHKVAERYGAFTLIILGEGIISVTRAFSRAISALSDDDSGTYIQVFLTILTLFLLYSFLFGTFDKEDHTGHGRAVIWQIIHFPLCFALLLLVAAMVNVVATISSTHGITLILDLLEPYTAAVNGTGATYLDPEHLRSTSKYMNKLALEPPFAQSITEIYAYLNETSPAVDPQVVYIQYATQIAYTAYQVYGIEIPIEATNTYYALYGLNTTWMENATERAHVRKEADHMFTEVVQEVLNDSYTGVLWLLPVAGCVLILSALRSMLWYRFIGVAHWIYHGSQIGAGVILGLLGILNVGSKHIDIDHLNDTGYLDLNPLYQVLFEEVPLVIVAVVYLVVYVGSGTAIWIVQRRQDRRNGAGGLAGKAGDGNLGNLEQSGGVHDAEGDPETYPMTERR